MTPNADVHCCCCPSVAQLLLFDAPPILLAMHGVCAFAADAAVVGDCSLHLLLLFICCSLKFLRLYVLLMPHVVAAAHGHGAIHSSAKLRHVWHVLTL